MDKQYYEHKFGEVIIKWAALPDRRGYNFTVILVEGMRTLWGSYVDADQPQQNFTLVAEPGISDPIKGSFTYASGANELRLTLICQPNIDITNEVLYYEVCCDVIPCDPCDDDDSQVECPSKQPWIGNDNNDALTPNPVVNPQTSVVPLDGALVYPIETCNEQTDLFPYLYLRPWPQIKAEQLASRFIQYNNPSTPAGMDNLYSQLLDIKQSGAADARAKILNTSTAYIDNNDDFIANLAMLGNIMAHFPLLYDWLKVQCHQLPCDLKLETFTQGVATSLTVNTSELYSYMSSETYTDELFLVWQSYFALINTCGYENNLLDQLSKILIIAQLITHMMYLNDAQQNDPDNAGYACKVLETLNQGINGVIFLDQALYPLPPQELEFSPPKGSNIPDGWIQPYAIGDLKIVRQQLKGYQLGEVAHIENVMPGETKQTTHRKYDIQQHSESEQLGNQQTSGHTSSSLNTDLLNEIQKTIEAESVSTTFNDLTTTYGTSSAPTATVTNGWTVNQEPQFITTKTNQLAKDITSKTANRIAQNMAQVRQHSHLNGTEEIQVHGFDNTKGTQSKVGIYRWVNKKYSAWTVNYGNRLMIEFMVTRPAAPYIGSVLNLMGIDLTPPPSLQSFGVHSYADITRENYAKLLTTYKVQNSAQYQPKSAIMVSSASLSSTDGLTSTNIPIAKDYHASKASVTYVLSGENQTLMGLVGGNVVTVPETLNPGQSTTVESFHGWTCSPTLMVSGQLESGTQCFIMNGETGSVPITVNASTAISSPPEAEIYTVNIEVCAVLSEAIYQQWQMTVYTVLNNAYDLAKAEYIEKTKGPFSTLSPGEHGSRDNALANRLLERTELKQAGLRQLLEQGNALVGDCAELSSPPDPQVVNSPRYQQFLDHMLEWGEMTYHFYPDLFEGEEQSSAYIDLRSGTDPLFASFLQAGRARLLVPVKPQHASVVLYYLATGMIFSANPELTPALAQNKAIINDLITLQAQTSHCSSISEPWNITIPTAMLMVQSGDQLPEFVGQIASQSSDSDE